jgi:hypothetical protein
VWYINTQTVGPFAILTTVGRFERSQDCIESKILNEDFHPEASHEDFFLLQSVVNFACEHSFGHLIVILRELSKTHCGADGLDSH